MDMELTGVESTGELLGHGAYGKVYKVLMDGKSYAAKCIHEIFFDISPDQFEAIKIKFYNECEICSTFYHPNVVQMIGIYYPPRSTKLPWLVMELMEESLTSRIKSTKQDPLQLHHKLSILTDVAEGLRYLHDEKHYFHRDLSSNNVMLTQVPVLVAKIGDFGTAKFIPKNKDTTAPHSQKPGTEHFMPPEALSITPLYSKSVDVFSLACIGLHLMSGKWPEPSDAVDYTTPERPVARTEIERRLKYFDRVSTECPLLRKLIEECLKAKSSKRPKIAEVCLTMRHLKAHEQRKEGNCKVTAKPEQVELTTKVDTKDEDKPIKSGEAKEEEVTAAKEEEPVVAKKPRKMYCLDPTDTVDIAVIEYGIRALKPITIPQFMKRTVDQLPDGKALCWKNSKEDPWQSLTYTQYLKLIYNTAKSFLKLGLEPYHSVGILGFNSVEWFASSMGAVFAGGLSTGVYTTSSPEACHYILENCKANIVVVEDQKQLDKILEIRDKLPHLKAIVQYKGELSKDYPDTYTWEKFLEVDKDMDDSVIDDIINKQEPNQCAMLMYTSGTTGNPKGVMLSHDNLTWVTEALLDTLGRDQWMFGRERVVSYLQLSHITGTIADMFLGVPFGATVYFAQPDALKGTLVVTLKEVKPTFFFGVPRVWEKMKEKMEEIGRTITGFKAKISAWGRGVGLRGNQNIQKGQSVPWGWTFANMLVFKKVREGLGLTECRQMTVGAAPIHRETLEFFMSVNMPVLELYGMSECTGPQTLSIHSATHWRTGSCGKTMSGAETKIDKPDEHGDGEILFRGRHIFMGYLGMAEKTRETIDDEGWLHSGDIGRIDKDGFLYITGRIKELIITAGGENVPPVYIEDCIKTEVPFLSNVMLIGDKRKFLTCLLTLKCIIHPDTGEATDDLQPQALKMFQDLGSECTTVSQVIETEDKAVFKAIQDGIDRYNTNHIISNAQKVQKWTLLDTDFTIPGGELGPTLKLKRPAVMKKYESTIEKFYAES